MFALGEYLLVLFQFCCVNRVALYLKLAWNSQHSCLSFPGAGITGTNHRVCPSLHVKPWLCLAEGVGNHEIWDL